MDRTQIIQAIQLARSVITTHGIMSQMSEYNKNRLFRDSSSPDEAEVIRCEFTLDPTRSTWDSNNCSCTINFSYIAATTREVDGGTYRDYVRRISFSTQGSDLDFAAFKSRENLISALNMIAEMLISLTPEQIVVTVETPEDGAIRRQKEHEQSVGSQIFHSLEKVATKNLRKGGKARLTRIPDSYLINYAKLPEAGSYRYIHVRRYNRRGTPVEKVSYRFVVPSHDNSCVRIYRTE